MGKPTRVVEVQALVRTFPKVRANGVGHSWHRGLFCAGDNSSSVNILTTGVRSVVRGPGKEERRCRLTSARNLCCSKALDFFNSPVESAAAFAITIGFNIDSTCTHPYNLGTSLRDDYDDTRRAVVDVAARTVKV